MAGMGNWKRRVFRKKHNLSKGSMTAHGRRRKRIAVPPPEGWKGGEPEHNGWKAKI